MEPWRFQKTSSTLNKCQMQILLLWLFRHLKGNDDAVYTERRRCEQSAVTPAVTHDLSSRSPPAGEPSTPCWKTNKERLLRRDTIIWSLELSVLTASKRKKFRNCILILVYSKQIVPVNLKEIIIICAAVGKTQRVKVKLTAWLQINDTKLTCVGEMNHKNTPASSYWWRKYKQTHNKMIIFDLFVTSIDIVSIR